MAFLGRPDITVVKPACNKSMNVSLYQPEREIAAPWHCFSGGKKNIVVTFLLCDLKLRTIENNTKVFYLVYYLYCP
jgi:uncharacterized protein YaeQ